MNSAREPMVPAERGVLHLPEVIADAFLISESVARARITAGDVKVGGQVHESLDLHLAGRPDPVSFQLDSRTVSLRLRQPRTPAEQAWGRVARETALNAIERMETELSVLQHLAGEITHEHVHQREAELVAAALRLRLEDIQAKTVSLLRSLGQPVRPNATFTTRPYLRPRTPREQAVALWEEMLGPAWRLRTYKPELHDLFNDYLYDGSCGGIPWEAIEPLRRLRDAGVADIRVVADFAHRRAVSFQILAARLDGPADDVKAGPSALTDARDLTNDLRALLNKPTAPPATPGGPDEGEGKA